MATITGGIRIITRIDPWPLALALFGIALAGLAFVNLAGHVAPSAKLNDRITIGLDSVHSLPVDLRLPLLIQLRDEQEKALSKEPAEPFAWARLAWLRLATQGDAQDAFAALRLSDLVSPGEPRQLPERALMWRQFAPVEDDEQKAYQDVLWQKAFQMQRDLTWELAVQNGIVNEVGDALKQTDPDLYEEWKTRKNN